MLAVRELLGLEPGAGLYVALGGQSPGSRGLVSRDAADDLGAEPHAADLRDPGEVDAALGRARERVGELVAGIGAGEVRPCPKRCSRSGCAHPSICRPGTR
jgi:hypothetical protein